MELTVEGEDRPPPHRYTVTTYTSDIRGAGTDANVSIKIFGDKCESTLLPLANRCVCAATERVVGCQSMGQTMANFDSPLVRPHSVLIRSKNNFERAETDEFVVETSELGKILKLQIGHDDS